VAAAFRDDAEPVLRILLEHRALERVELVADEDGDGHGGLGFVFRHCEEPATQLQSNFALERPSNKASFARSDGLLPPSLFELRRTSRFARNDEFDILRISPCLTSMLRLSSNYESWSGHLHGRRPRRRSRAFQ